MAPAWLWDSVPLRQAFASRDLAGALKVIRAATGLSQLEFATVLGWSPSHISRVESGQRDTLYDIRRLLEVIDALDMPRATLIPMIMGGDQQEEEFEMSMSRRELGGAFLGLAAAAGLNIQVPAKVDAAHVRYFSASVDQLYAQDQSLGGGALARDGLRLYIRARRMLDESDYTDATARQLMSVAGEIAACVSWLCYDAGDWQTARALHSNAHTLAEQAGNDQLSVRVMQGMALQLSEVGRENQHPGYARQAVMLSKRAAEVACPEMSPRLRALLAARQALAHSAVGDSTGFHAAMSQAWRQMDKEQTEERPGWLRFVSRSEIASHEARGRWYLGSPSGAADLYRTNCLAAELSPRNEAATRASLAAALAASGDFASAFVEGAAVLSALDAGGVRSQRTIRRLQPVRQLAAKHDRGGDFPQHYDQTVEGRPST
ncbi:MAG: helix-turn-helix transcriptional regulator [Pseudonocardia sp.]|nr:helix-turn-helix transcriptional regulator [Pseudonocardia sp.]